MSYVEFIISVINMDPEQCKINKKKLENIEKLFSKFISIVNHANVSIKSILKLLFEDENTCENVK